VKRSTLNFQRGDRKGARWPGYGDRHGVGPTDSISPQGDEVAPFSAARQGAEAWNERHYGIADFRLRLRRAEKYAGQLKCRARCAEPLLLRLESLINS